MTYMYIRTISKGHSLITPVMAENALFSLNVMDEIAFFVGRIYPQINKFTMVVENKVTRTLITAL